MSKSDWGSDLFGAMASMVPLAGPFLEEPAKKAFGAVLAEQARAKSVAISAACSVSGLSREDLADAVSRNPSLIPLAIRVLYAAGMTGQDEVLHALGAALCSAVAAPSEIDEVEMILIGLQDIRAVHIRIIELLREPPKWLDPDSTSTPPAENPMQAEIAGWNVEGIAYALSISVDAAYVQCVALGRAGFARSRMGLGGEGYRATPLGLTLLAVLDEHRKRRWQSESPR